MPFSRTLYIEQEDFMEEPPKKYFRLKPGGEVRLKHAYIIKCEEVIKDEAGHVVELHCTADLDSKTGGKTPAARSRARFTGWLRRRRSRQRCASTITSSRRMKRQCAEGLHRGTQ